MIQWLALLQIQGTTSGAVEIQLCRHYIKQAAKGLSRMLRSGYEQFYRQLTLSMEQASWTNRQAELVARSLVQPRYVWIPRPRHSPGHALPQWAAGMPATTFSCGHRHIADALRRAWFAGLIILPTWASTVMSMAPSAKRLAWQIAISWSIPQRLRSPFVSTMSQQLQRTKGVLDKSLRTLMRSVLQIARSNGIVDIAVAMNVRRLARLARWREFPGPLERMPWSIMMRPYPYPCSPIYLDNRTYHPPPYRRLRTLPVEIEVD